MLENRPEWSKRLRLARDSIKLSQREMAERLNTYQTTLVTYEAGKREPRVGFLQGIIRETGVDGDWLLTGEGDMYGEYKKIITKEEAIKALFGDKADEMILYLMEAIYDPFLRAIMYTSVNDYKKENKDRYDKTSKE